MAVPKIEIEEKFSNLWSHITVFTVLLTVVLFIVYRTMGDILWRGIFRLSALISFAAAVLSGLKVMEGKHSMTLIIQDGYLVVSYFRKEQQVHEDLFELDDIESVTSDQLPVEIFSNYFLANDQTVLLHLRNSGRELNLFELGGRILSVNRDAAERVVSFLEKHVGNKREAGKISDNE